MIKKSRLASMYGLMLGASLLTTTDERYLMPYNYNKWNYHQFKKRSKRRK